MTSEDQAEPDQKREGSEQEAKSQKPMGRVKRSMKRICSTLTHPNTPQYFIAVFTACLAWFAWEAWTEAQNGTAALREQISAQTNALDLSTRAILTSDLKNWSINPSPLVAGISPTVAFGIKNAGHQYAHIFSATYETAFAVNPPVNFGQIKRVPDFPALLSPDVDFPIIISGLPSITADQLPLLNSGRTFLWLRTIFIFRDDQAIVFQVRFTGRYGRGTNEKGAPDFRFTFPDSEIPRDRWSNFTGLRCLNVNKSEPKDLGCGDPR